MNTLKILAIAGIVILGGKHMGSVSEIVQMCLSNMEVEWWEAGLLAFSLTSLVSDEL